MKKMSSHMCPKIMKKHLILTYSIKVVNRILKLKVKMNSVAHVAKRVF